MKTSHFPLSLLPLPPPPFLLMLFLSRCLFFSHSENKLFWLYLFYKGRADHHRESFKLFQALPVEFPWQNAVVRSYFVAFKYITGDNILLIFAPHCHLPASTLSQIRKCFVVATSALMMHYVKSKAFDSNDKTGRFFSSLAKEWTLYRCQEVHVGMNEQEFHF